MVETRSTPDAQSTTASVSQGNAPSQGQPAKPKMTKSKRFGWVWLAPIVAALIAGWLAYSTISERGPLITILFDDASGLEAGKTAIKFKDVEVGRVESVQVSDDLQTIVLTARMVQGTEKFLNENTNFWVVKPRVGTGGVSGLDTLVSGAYIEFDPGSGDSVRNFRGLAEPPLVRSDVPGTNYQLRATSLGGLTRGSPIYHRGLEVGFVLGYEMRNETDDLVIHVFIRSPHDRLVTNNTRFWNASGLNVFAGAQGLGVEVESMQALLTGGIAFVNSGASRKVEIAEAEREFPLYESETDALEAVYSEERVPLRLEFSGSVRGLVPGSAVELRGIKIGEVKSVELQMDTLKRAISIPVIIEIEPQRFKVVGLDPNELEPYSITNELISNGLRARLDPGSFITGELVVSFVFNDDHSLDGLDMSTDPPTMPTVPSELDELTASVSGILRKIASLPLETIAEEMRGTVGAARNLIESPDLQQSIAGLNQAMVDLEGLMGEVRGEAGPLIRSLRQTAAQAERAIREATVLISSAEGTVGPESQLSYDMEQMMQELTSAARSVRVFADYLERHPEALLRGKQGGFQ